MPGCAASMIGGPLFKTHWLHERVRADAAGIGNLRFHLQAPVRVMPVVSIFDPDEVIRREVLGDAVADLPA